MMHKNMPKIEVMNFTSTGNLQELKKVFTQLKITVLNSALEEPENTLNMLIFSGWKPICQKSQSQKNYQN